MAKTTPKLGEWGNVRQVYDLFGFSPSYLRQLADEGRIKSVLVKKRREAIKGVRLFNIQSIREMLESASVS